MTAPIPGAPAFDTGRSAMREVVGPDAYSGGMREGQKTPTPAREANPTRKERREAARAERVEAERAAAARERRKRRLLQLAGVIGLAAILVGIVIAVTSGGSSTKKTPAAASTNALLAGIPQKGTVLGDPKAPATLVEFADLQCPICQRYSTQVFPTLARDYLRTGKVKMDFRNFAFIGPDSTRAAQAALAAGEQNKLWQFVERFYANQQPENTSYATDGFLRKVAGQVPGLNVGKLMSDRFDPKVRAQLSQVQGQVTKLGVTGTPTIFVGKTTGTLSEVKYSDLTPSQFTKPIDAALQR
jgi:protein-disulfide isomerase